MKTEKDLSYTQRNSYLKALGAFELRDYDLVVTLMGRVVAEEPEFLAGRKLLREAEVLRLRSGKPSLLGVSASSPSIDKSKARRAIETGDFLEAIREAERALETDPLGVQPNKDLHEAAERLARNERMKIGSNPAATDALETARGKMRSYEAIARFGLETIALDDRDKAKQAGAFHDLGRYLMSIEEFNEAIRIYEEILRTNPRDREARDKAKEAAGLSSRRHPRPYVWIDPFPLPRKDRMSNQESEDAPRNDRTIREESTEEIAKNVYEAHEAGKPDKEAALKLAHLYFIREDYEKALEYYRYLSALANDTDPGLLRKISDTEVRRLTKHIADKEKELAALASCDPAAAAIRSEIQETRRCKEEQMLGEARERVKRNPTDPQYRFELGEQLALAGHFKEAVPELQKALGNSHTRTRAQTLSLLGKCYIELNMLDLAVNTLTDAAGEIPGMDGIKKAIIYNLGLVYERLGDKEKSLDCMKQIYEDPNSDSDDGLAGAPVPVRPSPTGPPKAGSAAKKLPPNQKDNA